MPDDPTNSFKALKEAKCGLQVGVYGEGVLYCEGLGVEKADGGFGSVKRGEGFGRVCGRDPTGRAELLVHI